MSNYVQIRFESNKKDKAIGMLKHNMRTLKPHYLRNNMAHNVESNSIIFNDKIIDINDGNKRDYYFNMKHKLELIEQDLKDNNKNFRIKKHALVIDSIITLSNSINDKYKNNEITKEQLDNLFLKSINKLEFELGLKYVYASIHYDEKTPHMHIAFKNYYKENDKYKGVSTQLKKSYSKSQDIVGEVFSEIGFTRGIKGSKEKHLTVKEMHIKEKEIELEKQKLKLQQEQENLKQQEIKNKELENNLELFKQDIEKELEKFENDKKQEIENNIENEINKNRDNSIKKLEKIENINKITQLAKIEKETKLFSDNVDYKIDLQGIKNINKYINIVNSVYGDLKQTIAKNNINFNNNLTTKYELNELIKKNEKENKRYKEIQSKYIELKIFENDYKDIVNNYKSLENENKELKQELDNKDNTINSLYKNINIKNKKIKELNNVIYKLDPNYYNDISR